MRQLEYTSRKEHRRRILPRLVVEILVGIVVSFIVLGIMRAPGYIRENALNIGILLVIFSAVLIVSYIIRGTRLQLLVDRVYPNQDAAKNDIMKSLDEAKIKIKILVARGTSIFGTKPPIEIRNKIANRSVLKGTSILMVSPDSEYVEERAPETGYGSPDKPQNREEPDAYRNEAIRAIQYTTELCKERKDLDMNLYDEKIVWRFFIIDDTLFLGFYPPFELGIDGGENACILKIHKNTNRVNAQMYLAFERFFDYLKVRFEKSDRLKLELCQACRGVGSTAARRFVDKFNYNAAEEIGGCYRCQ